MFTILHRYEDGTEMLIGDVADVTRHPAENRASNAGPEWDIRVGLASGGTITIPVTRGVTKNTGFDPCVIVMNDHGKTVAKYNL